MTTNNYTEDVGKVASPILMPPPKLIPKCQQSVLKPQVVQKPHVVPKPQVVLKPQVAQKPQVVPKPQVVQKPQVVPKPQVVQKPHVVPKPQVVQKPHQYDLLTAKSTSGKILESCEKGSSERFTANITPNPKTLLPMTKQHCSIPSEDVKCYTTNIDGNIDDYTKQMVRYQISRKIYAKSMKRVNICVTPHKLGEVLDAKRDVQPSYLKVNKKHFKEKNMNIEDIDIESINQPIRSSTPTPSVSDSTILAGHIDYSMIDDLDSTMCTKNLDACEQDDDIDVLDEVFQQYVQESKGNSSVHRKKEAKKTGDGDKISDTDEGITDTNKFVNKDNYCKDWMEKHDGINTNNVEAPPSLYAPSLDMSMSLMDITSVSRNLQPETGYDTKINNKTGRGITNSKDYNNTQFM